MLTKKDDYPWIQDDDLGALSLLMRNAGQYPLLTAQQERDLGQCMAAGVAEETKANPDRRVLDEAKKARELLICSNLRLVVSIAKKYKVPSGLELFDLVQFGHEGLIDAADRYDYAKGYRFSTYATWWIRQNISRGLMNESRMIRLPVHIFDKLYDIKQEMRKLTALLEREPTNEELAASLHMTVEQLHTLRSHERQTMSLDTPLGSDDDDRCFGDIIEHPDSLDLDGLAIQSIEKDRVHRLLSALSEREQLVIARRFGLFGHIEQTLAEISRDLHLSRERIRQIEEKAMAKLQEVALNEPKLSKKRGHRYQFGTQCIQVYFLEQTRQWIGWYADERGDYHYHCFGHIRPSLPEVSSPRKKQKQPA